MHHLCPNVTSKIPETIIQNIFPGEARKKQKTSRKLGQKHAPFVTNWSLEIMRLNRQHPFSRWEISKCTAFLVHRYRPRCLCVGGALPRAQGQWFQRHELGPALSTDYNSGNCEGYKPGSLHEKSRNCLPTMMTQDDPGMTPSHKVSLSLFGTG